MDKLVKQMNEEVRKMQIKNVIRTYFIINNANSFDVSAYGLTNELTREKVKFSADAACEALLRGLMTEQEYEHFLDCNEFDGDHWFELVKDYFDLVIVEKAKEEAMKEGMIEIERTVISNEQVWDDIVYVYGTMHGLDPKTYENGCSPMVVRVTNGKIDLVDGV
jgi:hypothetical protein